MPLTSLTMIDIEVISPPSTNVNNVMEQTRRQNQGYIQVKDGKFNTANDHPDQSFVISSSLINSSKGMYLVLKKRRSK